MEKNKKEQKEKQVEYGIAEVGEDATKYGEFISSYFAWVSLPEERDFENYFKVGELEEITSKKKDKKQQNNMKK